ncbi:response regulator transcription factor [Ferrimonas marina]|uniref:Two component transcriptional regulator, LuxR family n=1 Tax=Ferrimonas marina TaxID=299255 RepID=A0A1M5QXE0_9GAMM|nr:response regulator transcription factor [Ferrimonas marina]SHH18420.1 two component transcriptional regulator, LuxR family [Ferrimonas marina]
MDPMRVAIADDHPLFRSALLQALKQCLPHSQLHENDSLAQLLDCAGQYDDLELVFLDLHMPGSEGFSGLVQLLNSYPDLVVIMVSSEDDPAIMRRALSFGASAFVPKSADVKTMASAIDTVLNGDSWLPEGAAQQGEPDQSDTLASQLARLTPQQLKVLSMIADGQLNKQIAYDLSIQETTVKQHVSAILGKLGVNNRTQAGLLYQQVRQYQSPQPTG